MTRRCLDCPTPIQRTKARGPLPQRCPECREARNREMITRRTRRFYARSKLPKVPTLPWVGT